MSGRMDLVGQRFGMLVVVECLGSDGKNTSWRCLCDCGKETVSRTYQLRSQGKRSCGCITQAAVAARLTKHGCATGARLSGGRSGTRTYSIWTNMKARCANPQNKSYARYGGRGIIVCAEWAHDFEAFLRDMGDPPGPEYSIERIDVDGNYAPSNCRWATVSEQNRNKRSTRRISFRGQTKSLTDWAEEFGLPVSVLGWRLNRGWDVERAMTEPMQKLPRRKASQATQGALNAMAIAEGERFLRDGAR